MKKWIALILVFVLVMGMAGCGKSAAATAADDLIAAIGIVTLESEEAISNAEKAISSLDEKDLKSLENITILEKAREEYNALVRNDEEERQAKADAEKVAVVEAMIDAIGEVTLESQSAIDAAQNAYDALESRLQCEVSNYNLVADAENILASLHIEQVEHLIDSIGTVDTGSGDAIKAAKEAYNSLTEEEKALVNNREVLTEAAERYKTIMTEHAESLLKTFTLRENVFNQDTKFYYPSVWKFSADGTTSFTDSTFIRPMIVIQNNSVAVRIIYNYTDYHWVFWTKLTVVGNKDRFTVSKNYTSIVREAVGSKVFEYYDDADDIAANIERLRIIAESDTVQMRFQGSDYYADFTLNEADLKAIRQTLEVYDALMECGYKMWII